MSDAELEQPSLMEPLLRLVATAMLLIAVVQLLAALPGLFHHLFAIGVADKPSLTDRLAATLAGLSGPLRFCAVGGMALVTSQIRFGRPKRRVPFDFKTEFHDFIQWERPAQAWRRRITGLLCVIGAPMLSLVGNATMRGAAKIEAPVALLIVPLGLGIVLCSMLLFLAGLRQLAPRAENMLRRTRLRPILYLRSFGSDAQTFDRGLGQYVRLLFLGPWGHQTTEHALALAVRDFRPLVAIGPPGERLPPLGAARLYVSRDWQQAVTKMVEVCPLVILRIGDTPGFWWEIEHLIDKCDPRKVLVYLPKHDRTYTYQYWRTRAAQHFPLPLPASPGNAMFLGFGPGWEPRLYGRTTSFGTKLRRLLGGRAPMIREAINEAFRQLGARPTKLPLLLRECVLATLLLLFLFANCIVPLAALGGM